MTAKTETAPLACRATGELKCMEVSGGFRAIDREYSTPGMKIWLYSRPQQADKSGGDVYYLSSCASGRITRVLLADISGHGAALKPISDTLRNIMRRNINRISPRRLISQLNSDFEAADDQGSFATSLVASYFYPLQKLTWNSAGHPAPLIKRKGSQQWESLQEQNKKAASLKNLPLGVFAETRYESHNLMVEPGDLLLFFTDGLFEAHDRDGKVLGIERLLELLNGLPALNEAELIPQLLQQIEQVTGDTLAGDDLTLILCQIHAASYSFRRNLMAPFRLISGLWN